MVKLVMLHIFIVILLLCTCVKFGINVLPKKLKLQPKKIATTSNMCSLRIEIQTVCVGLSKITTAICWKFVQKSFFRKVCSEKFVHAEKLVHALHTEVLNGHQVCGSPNLTLNSILMVLVNLDVHRMASFHYCDPIQPS